MLPRKIGGVLSLSSQEPCSGSHRPAQKPPTPTPRARCQRSTTTRAGRVPPLLGPSCVSTPAVASRPAPAAKPPAAATSAPPSGPRSRSRALTEAVDWAPKGFLRVAARRVPTKRRVERCGRHPRVRADADGGQVTAAARGAEHAGRRRRRPSCAGGRIVDDARADAEIAANPLLRKGFADPRRQQAMAEMREPQAACASSEHARAVPLTRGAPASRLPPRAARDRAGRPARALPSPTRAPLCADPGTAISQRCAHLGVHEADGRAPHGAPEKQRGREGGAEPVMTPEQRGAAGRAGRDEGP